MDIGKALTFFTEDERWLEKLAIGTGLTVISLILSPVLIGIVGFLIVAGYSIRLLQNVRDGNATPLPEWNQWGEDLVRGFKWAVVGIVWALPLIVFGIPTSIGQAITNNGNGYSQGIGTLFQVCGGCLSFLYGILLLVMAPGFTIAYARDEEIRSGLQLTDIWNWTRGNLGQVVIVAVAYVVASILIFLAAGIVGTLLCLIGLIVTIPLGILATNLFRAHLYGQLAREFPMTTSLGGSTFSSNLPSTGGDNPPSGV
jgi:uncharacterized protein DUF4013